MIHHAKKHESGFTLIELLLALAFIGFVLIFATTTIIQILRTYNQGLAVKEINQTGRATLEDISRILRGTSTTAVVSLAQTAPNVTGPTANRGRLCLAGTSYVWNFTNSSTNRYTDGTRVNFARVNDPGSAMCVGPSYPSVNKAQATELLSNNVWVQQLTVVPAVGQSFYDIFIQMSTVDDPANPAQVTNWAAAPEQRVTCRGGGQGQFCAVANFSTSVNARGGN
ncbi:MAG TPA: prepilin-type N-terminal cleavage/methylation domain-containing protein [Candidatus Saccharimonadales bacterium]|nr:prepilin-type N-terminal cleavage/methylation domain-containing protein [Candidatus Saccharimonadales bacterium]